VKRLLWSRRRRRQQGGFKFRRPVPLGPYVVDFACYAARLVVEVDGPGHDASVDAPPSPGSAGYSPDKRGRDFYDE
jgi:very-short-patch-repair endonuclease